MGVIMRLYLCDRLKECSLRLGCSRNGGECSHTSDISHARNGPFKIEEENGRLIIPDNVKAYTHNDGSMYLIEEEEEERSNG